jgi:hypothetical protein
MIGHHFSASAFCKAVKIGYVVIELVLPRPLFLRARRIKKVHKAAPRWRKRAMAMPAELRLVRSSWQPHIRPVPRDILCSPRYVARREIK